MNGICNLHTSSAIVILPASATTATSLERLQTAVFHATAEFCKRSKLATARIVAAFKRKHIECFVPIPLMAC